jgi:hypothetical protein
MGGGCSTMGEKEKNTYRCTLKPLTAHGHRSTHRKMGIVNLSTSLHDIKYLNIFRATKQKTEQHIYN